ncbi:hypothetical protein Tcan_08648 [Toxocara canis]|uniref:Uncharacterized protein n=1 Tax=Toxocara canis TaxID=6265 RepID=A0A0B2W0J6_TOXCA|nr:hypothetical protein Tcan_08648 [Toxocara canis]
MGEQQFASAVDQSHMGSSSGSGNCGAGAVRFQVAENIVNRKIAIARSCSDLEPRIEGHWLHRSLSRGSSNSTKELQLVGQCRACARDYKCSCCHSCNHLVVVYVPQFIKSAE